MVAYSNGRLPGDLQAGASAAADGDPATAWQPGFGSAYQKGDWLEYDLPAPITFDHLNLQIVADGRHSVPTSLTVSTENGSRSLALPPIADGRVAGATTAVTVHFPALTGSRVRITVTGVRLEDTTNYYAPSPSPAARHRRGGHPRRAGPGRCRRPCRGPASDNLLTIDGAPVSVEIVGSTSAALANGEMTVEPCGADGDGIHLAAGTHVLQTAPGHTPASGWNLDQLVLDSAPGGGSGTPAPGATLPATQPGPAPTVTVGHTSATHRVPGGARRPRTLRARPRTDPQRRLARRGRPGDRGPARRRALSISDRPNWSTASPTDGRYRPNNCTRSA